MMVSKKDSKTTAKPAKKTVAKKSNPAKSTTVAKKATEKPAKKVVAKKPVAKKVVAKPAKKVVAKPAKKTVATKQTVKKPVAKKVAVKKAVAPKKTVAKAPAKKVETKKPVATKKAIATPKNTEKKNSKLVSAKTKNAKTTKKVVAKKSKDDTGVKVLMSTTHGDIELHLMQDKAPVTVINFLKYTKANHYNGLIFHRVINGFVVQGGGYDAELNMRDVAPAIRSESDNGLKNERGTIAMARGIEPNSATSQFFINLVDNQGLDYKGPEFYGYTVFGKVTKGLDVVDKIASIPTIQKMPHEKLPIETVIIKTVKII